MPATTPLDEPTVAAAVLLLSHVPPAIALLNEILSPLQTEVAPVIAADGFTVIF